MGNKNRSNAVRAFCDIGQVLSIGGLFVGVGGWVSHERLGPFVFFFPLEAMVWEVFLGVGVGGRV